MGLFITFEGIDGSGKSTQIELLKKLLKEKGHPVHVYREPGGTDVSEQIRSILLDSDLNINPITEVLLFSSARSQLIAEEVIPKLKKGGIIILDRFYDSTVAYQGYGRKSLPIEQINQINRIASHHQVPDVTFYLRLTPRESAARTTGQAKDRIERTGDDFFERVYRGFEELSRRENRYITIDATLTPGELHRQIADHVLKFLEGDRIED